MIELKELVGKHKMPVAGTTDVRHPFDGDKSGICFFLDDMAYMVFEDQNDGYRSCAGPIFSAKTDAYDVIPNYEYINRDVVVRHVKDSRYGGDAADIIEIIDVETAHVWLRVGTDNIDDYYPSFVAEWNPMPPAAP